MIACTWEVAGCMILNLQSNAECDLPAKGMSTSLHAGGGSTEHWLVSLFVLPVGELVVQAAAASEGAMRHRHQKMLRVVVREDLSFEMASDLIEDMKRVVEWLDHHFIYDGACPSLPLTDAELPSMSRLIIVVLAAQQARMWDTCTQSK